MTAQKCSGNPFEVPSSVPAGTGISSGGLSYITQESASFHGTGASGGCYNYAANSNVKITAQAPGSKYNVSGGNFSVAGRADVSAGGSASSGTDDIVTVLSQADVETAKQKLSSGGTSASDFTKSWEKKLTDGGAYIITQTLKAADPAVTANPAVGQPASNANITVKTTYTVLTVKKTDLKTIVEAKLAGQIDKSKQKLNDDFLNNLNISVQNQSSPKVAALTVGVDTTAVPIINVATVKKVAEGKKAGDIQKVINTWAGVEDVNVKLSPFWVSKVPNKDSKVTVVLKEVKTSSKDSGQP
jgi:hypothetical protein